MLHISVQLDIREKNENIRHHDEFIMHDSHDNLNRMTWDVPGMQSFSKTTCSWNIAVGVSIFHPRPDDFVDYVSVVSFPAFFVLTDNGTRISRIVETVLKRRLHGYVNLF